MVLPALLVYVAVYLLAELLRPKPKVEDARPAKLGDFQLPTATEDRVVPIIWGTVKMGGANVVWYGDLKQKPIKVEIKTGLFSSTDQTVGFHYKLGIQLALCRGGPLGVDALLRWWVGDKEVFSGTQGAGTLSIDKPNLFGGDDLGQGGMKGDLTFFIGTQSQPISTYLAPFQQEGGDTPAYVGTCYAVWERGYIGNTTTIPPWAFELQRIPIGLSVTDSLVNGSDANPAHVIFEILTDTEWGFALPSADVDVANFQSVANILKNEGNGFSFQLESPREMSDLLEEIERQIDGKVFINQQTGLWQIKLARNDYVVASLALLDETNVLEVRDFSRGSWHETSNVVSISFVDRAKDYFGTSALAQDMANNRIQGAVVTASMSFPGVKDAALANNIAWRELRGLSYPLAKATVTVDRKFWNLAPLSVVKWSNDQLGISNLVMRVMRVDLGELVDGKVELTLVQDIFAQQEASFDDPFGTGWVPPSEALVAVPAGQQVVMESPRAFLTRDPAYLGGELLDKIWAGMRAQVNESAFEIRERHAPVTPAGAYAPAGQVFGCFLIGALKVAIGRAVDPTTITIVANPDLQADLIEGIVSGASSSALGVGLVNVLLVDGEVFIPSGAVANGVDVDLTGCRRGALDTVQGTHVLGASVFLLSVAGGLTSTTFPAGDAVEVKLLPMSSTADQLSEASATVVAVNLDDRLRRPYPPAQLKLNGTVYPTGSVSLDVMLPAGTTEDDNGIRLQYVRRDFRTSDELKALLDEASLPGDFPAANTTEYQVEVRNDPAGLNTLLFTIAYGVAQNDQSIRRTEVLRYTDGVIPTTLRVAVRARHTLDAVVWTALLEAIHDFAATSAELGALFNLTTLDDGDISPAYTAVATGTFTFRIAVDLLTSGAVEARINGGGFVTVISSGAGLSGTLPGVTSGDTIEVRHTQTGANASQTLLLIENPSATRVAYGVVVV